MRPAGRFGRLEVVRQLACGGMGGVYLAVDRDTRQRVALKVLDAQLADNPEIVERLASERTLTARANHDGVVRIFDVRTGNDGAPFLVMEYLEGETLATLASRGSLELDLLTAIMARAAFALASVHEAGVVHCDVKQDNIFVLDELAAGWPRVKVIDFGVSREVDAPPLPDAAIAGTPWCMAPEQWGGRPTPKSDVYSLGCVLYELATGAPPFEGSLLELMAAHLERRPARPSWLRAMPQPLERTILRALAKQPEVRPTMRELAQELDRLTPPAFVTRKAG
ncbi:MAG: serine/threonine-protein kinase [Kofleriaceae bacterium]